MAIHRFGVHRQYTARMKKLKALFVALTCLASLAAQAQWQWIDKDGRKVFSDRAPPADIPAKSILKQPGSLAPRADIAAPPPEAGAAPAQVASPTAPVPDAPKLSAVDKDLADRKKQAEAAAAAKVKAEDERVAKARVQNCERARAGKALMDSGVRVSLTNAKGEREVLDDAGRAAQMRQIQQQIDANCR